MRENIKSRLLSLFILLSMLFVACDQQNQQIAPKKETEQQSEGVACGQAYKKSFYEEPGGFVGKKEEAYREEYREDYREAYREIYGSYPPMYGEEDENNPLSVFHLHSYPGVVSIQTSKGSRGTGFFISRNIIATAFHVIEGVKNCKDPIEENIYLKNFPERSPFEVRTRRVQLVRQREYRLDSFEVRGTGREFVPMVPVSEIVALDAKHDIALLRVEGYTSEFFYPPVESVPDDILSQEVKIPGFSGSNPTILKGKSLVVSNYDRLDGDSFFGFAHDPAGFTKGVSGSPVLSSNSNLLGVYVEGKDLTYGVGLDLFTSVENLWNLLEKPSLSCVDTSCIRDELRVLKEQAESGDRQAQYEWGWLKKAAENGHPNAQFLLGKINFLYGRGPYTYWLEKSAAQGSSSRATVFRGHTKWAI